MGFSQLHKRSKFVFSISHYYLKIFPENFIEMYVRTYN